LQNERAYWVAWSQVYGIGATLLLRIYKHFGSLETAWEASAADLEAVDGLGEVTAAMVVQRRSHLNPDTLLAEHSEKNPNFWTPADPEYPRLLLEIPDPPPILYYRGQMSLRDTEGMAIALVGTRSPSEYGRRWTRKISTTLATAGFTVVSGLADGVDTVAHHSCLEAGGRTIAVLGTGVNIVYPASNRRLAQRIDQEGLLLSEYPAGTQPDRAHFPRRNRIIAGLCRVTLVLEAPSRSGALITASLANDYGRDIYALPGAVDNPKSIGCLELIGKGAQIVLSEAHLLDLLGAIPQLDAVASEQLPLFAQAPSPPPELPPDLQQVLSVISGEAIAIDRIVQQAGLPTPSVQSALLQLELEGLVAQLPGMRYQRV
jgi:DNA processing protein